LSKLIKAYDCNFVFQLLLSLPYRILFPEGSGDCRIDVKKMQGIIFLLEQSRVRTSFHECPSLTMLSTSNPK
jgi:hypothetical protein